MTVIRNLVTIDEHAEFRNDVQLSDFENQETNLALLKSYLFTTTAPQGQESSIGLLRAIIESFLNPRLDNRITAIANYGHGKSHLALVLANYFGKANESSELKIILNKIDQAISDTSQRKRYHEFRENRNEFLVIRLRGDKPQSLREQFVLSLEKSLQEHAATQKVELPFWYQKAERLLQDLSAEQLKKANHFLESLNMDVPGLIQDVQARKETSYDLCIKVFTELHGVAPNLHGEVGQREMLNWVARNYCGDDKPLGGIFVLFDEFSLYIQRYGQRNAVGELQDLLNGIEDQKGKSVFVAFAQHDPIIVARNSVRNASTLDSLEKELNRIPRKVPMYSLMESVINAYLAQPETAWRNFRMDPQVRGPIAKASNIAMDLFSKRYEQVLRWDPEKFDEIVTKGCFPLHPLTTALLCDLRLQGVGSVGNPRTVLGFVFEQIQQKKDESAIGNGNINWVLPIFLVDYFNEYLPETSIMLYENAVRNLDPEAPVEQQNLLKALLLQDIAKLSVRRDTQVLYMAEATGMKTGEADKQLRLLSGSRVIRYEQATGLYSFYPVSIKPHRLEEIIDERLSNYKVSWDTLIKLRTSQLPAIPVDIPWGNADDWAADEIILTQEFFTAQRLKELIADYKLTLTGDLVEGKRGCVIWLLGETDEEVNALRINASKTVDEAFSGDNPPAVIVMMPKRPCPDLITTYFKNLIVESFSQDDRNEVGIEIYNLEAARLKQRMVVELSVLRGDLLNYRTVPHSNVRYVVPNAYRVGIQSLGEVSLSRVLQELYKLVYRYSPPEFFKEFAVSGRGVNNLRNATRSVANVLLKNGMPGNREAIFAQPVSKRLCETFLLPKWQLFSPDYRIREPGNSRIQEAWNYLEAAFPAGVKEKKVKDLLIKLMNPPFGFDYNTLTLLFTAWIGFHSHDVQICLQNRVVSMDKLSELLTSSNSSKQFIHQISGEYHLAISRRDSGQQEREIQEIISKANQNSFTQNEASDATTKIEEFCRDNPEATICGTAQQTAINLATALKQAEEYDKQAREILDSIRNERSISVVLPLHNKISNLVKPTLVRITLPEESAIHEKWLNRITQMVDQDCKALENVQRIVDVGLNQQRLQELKNHLKKANLPALQKRVDDSLKILVEKQKELEEQAAERPLQVEIQSMDTKAGLQVLYQHRDRLKEIKSNSSTTISQRDARMRQIEQEISNLEDYCKKLVDAVERIDTLEMVKEWQRNLYQNFNRYASTSFEAQLHQAEKRVHQLEELFQAINAITRRTPADLYEARSLVNELEELKKDYHQHLGDSQLAVIDMAKGKVDGYIQGRVQEAKKWYENVVSKYRQGTSLLDIRDSIKMMPPFLMGDEKAALESLRVEVARRLEEDTVILIESKFRELGDPAKRRLCLERLQKIMDE